MIASAPLPAAVSVEVGQVYGCTSVHAGRRLEATIGRIDQMPTGTIVVSISVMDKDPAARIPVIGHIPFAADVFRTSCPTLLAQNESVPEVFSEGYRMWRDAKGGYYTITVDQAVDAALTTMMQQQQPPAVERKL